MQAFPFQQEIFLYSDEYSLITLAARLIGVVVFFGILLAWLPIIWAIIDIIKSKKSDGEKIFWVIIIIGLSYLGLILYLIISKWMKIKFSRKKKKHH